MQQGTFLLILAILTHSGIRTYKVRFKYFKNIIIL